MKIKRIKQGVFLVLALLLSMTSLAARIEITRLRVIRKPHHWQFVFETTAPVTHTYHYLTHPYRAVFDFPNVHLRKMFSAGAYVTTPVTKIRGAPPR